MKNFIYSGLILSGLLVYGCRQMPEQPDNSKIKLNLPSTPFDYSHVPSPSGTLEVYYEDGTLIDNNKATIGRVLFYDKALSFNNSTACASCHFQENGFSDTKATSVGFDGISTMRNSMPIGNLFNNIGTGYFWDTRSADIEDMVFRPIEDHIEMGFENIALITEKLSNLPYYKELFKKAYGDETITTDRMRESLGQFLFSIVNVNSKFDKGQRTNFSNFSFDEKDGMNLFVENGCSSCHFINSNFSPDGAKREKMANIGLDERDKDIGNNHQYRIPDLRNVAITGPYMHDGRFTSLNQVISHYGAGVKANPYLSEELKTDKKPKVPTSNYFGESQNNIVVFMQTLTDEFTTTNVRFSNPFSK